jgi:hypothetical protein
VIGGPASHLLLHRDCTKHLNRADKARRASRGLVKETELAQRADGTIEPSGHKLPKVSWIACKGPVSRAFQREEEEEEQEEERMMGLEPTTFCMASVLWFESRRRASPHG